MDLKRIIFDIKNAELQFRLAVTVRLANVLDQQSLEAPTRWSHGKHTVNYEEIALTKEQADIASDYLERTATYLMSITIKDALKDVYGDPKNHSDNRIVAAYQISRLIRNAFAHSPIEPKWSIDPNCRDKQFAIADVIFLNTKGLHGKKFDWRHYGGLLAIFRLSKFVRIDLFGDSDTGKNRKIAKPRREIIQQGNLILTQVDKIPDGAKLLSQGKTVDLGDGHSLSIIPDEAPE